MGGKFKFPAQGSNLAPFVGNGTKINTPSEIKPPLAETVKCLKICGVGGASIECQLIKQAKLPHTVGLT